MNFLKNKDAFYFTSLGGAEEIGMNIYLYHYRGKWIVVDMGMGFADDYYPGVDLLVPDITFLLNIKKDIAAIVLTHAHEDHIGALPYLWAELQVPVYCTGFTAAIVKAKMAEVGISDTSFVKELSVNAKFNIADFQLEYVALTHSVLEMQGLYIKTEFGNVFHTGDWKFDHDPVVGQPSNIKRLKEIGKEGVLALICDSTNIFNEGTSGSEGDLSKHLLELVSRRKEGLVVVTTFASNIARVVSLAKIAKKVGRKVALAGRSLWRMTEAARQCGYLDDIDEFVKTSDIASYKREELMVIATGCQGEPMAAISKLAREMHPDFHLNSSDMVIFSSKIIPGNEKKIFELFNLFARNKVHVMTENDHFVHVSGHPSRDEVAEMYKMIKPKIAIPVHGEVLHTFEHVDFAKEMGVEKAFRIDNGQVVQLDTGEVVGKIEVGCHAIDGNFLLNGNGEILKMRRRLRDQGMVHVTAIVNKKGKLLKSPHVIAPGVLDSKYDEEYFDLIVQEVREYIEEHTKFTPAEAQSKVRSLVKKIIKRETGKEPDVVVSIHKLLV